MKLIVTNDDGIEAEGLQTLVRLASQWGEVVVVAPAEPQSGVGHQLTTDRPIRVDKLTEESYRIWGTPADCSRLALNCLGSDSDWVLSGINHGGNLGVDVYESGTVAAAREAAIHGCKAVALSHYTVKGRSIDWPLAAERLRPVLDSLLNETLEAGCFLNVNLPHPEHNRACLETKHAPVDTSPHIAILNELRALFDFSMLSCVWYGPPFLGAYLCLRILLLRRLSPAIPMHGN